MRTEIEFGEKITDYQKIIEVVNFLSNYCCKICTISDMSETVISIVYSGRNYKTFTTALFNKYPKSKVVKFEYSVDEEWELDSMQDINGIEYY